MISAEDKFSDSTMVKLFTRLPGTIHYTIDGTEANALSPVYSSPFKIDQTTTINVCVADSNGTPLGSASPTISKR